jgi:hypothetical protein
MAISASNFTTVADAQAAIQAHPLCAQFLTTPQKYVVFYPAAYTIPGGAAVAIGTDQLAALNLLYQRLENFWNAQLLQVPAT